jgi:hypothetical protein
MNLKNTRQKRIEQHRESLFDQWQAELDTLDQEYAKRRQAICDKFRALTTHHGNRA